MAICRKHNEKNCFHTKWIKLINGKSHQSFLLCVKKQRAIVCYFVLKNREPKGFIKSSWGPVKDPLSPFFCIFN